MYNVGTIKRGISMRFELADGTVLNVTDIEIVNSEIDKLDKKNDHLILGDDSYIQIAFLGHDLFETEYKDAEGYFQAKNQDLDLSLIKKFFEGFLNGSSDWKNLTPWELIDDNDESSETGSSSSNYSSTGRSSGNFKDNLVEDLKRDAVNWGKRKLKRFLKF